MRKDKNDWVRKCVDAVEHIKLTYMVHDVG